MKTYQYQIIRYFPDRVTGEFVNVGVVLYIPEDRFFRAMVTNKYGRITHFFNGVNGNFVIKTLKHICSEFSRIEEKINGLSLEKHSSSIESLTSKVLPPDDSSLILTPAKKGIDLDGQQALNHLFDRIVTHYVETEPSNSPTDDDVWKRHYKKYFDELGITKKLTTHQVSTKAIKFDFDKSWKNEVWHCYETVSFDLATQEAINKKGLQWSGTIQQLEKSGERLHLNLLINESKKFNTDELVKEMLDHSSEKIEVTIVTQSQAEEFAQEVKLKIEQHEAEVGDNTFS